MLAAHSTTSQPTRYWHQRESDSQSIGLGSSNTSVRSGESDDPFLNGIGRCIEWHSMTALAYTPHLHS
jgi:hypothetical protein